MAIENAKTLNVRIKNKYDSYENWAASGLILEAGEIAIAYTTVDVKVDNGAAKHPALLMKVGDGEKTFANLPWLSARAADVLEAVKSEAGLTSFIKTVVAASDGDLAALTTRVTTAEGEIDALQLELDKAETGLKARMTTAEGAIDALEALVGDTKVATQIANAITELNLANTYEAKGEAAKVQTALNEYKTSNDAAVQKNAADISGEIARAKAAEEANTNAINAIKDGTTIDSFADVETALAGKETSGAAAQALADAKIYADGLNTAMDSRVDALEAIDHTHTFVESELNKIADGDVAKWNAAEQNAKDYTDEKIEDMVGTETVSAQISTAITNANLGQYETKEDAGKKLTEAKTYADGLNTAMNTRVEALEAIDHDHGNKGVLDGITAEKVAAWDAAEQNAKDYADGLDEVMDGRVAALEAKFTGDDSVDAKIAAAVAAEAEIARAAEKANADAIDAIEADYLKAADKTDLQDQINVLDGLVGDETVAKQITDVTDPLDARVKAVEDDYLTSADKTELEGKITTNANAIERLTNGVSAEEIDGVNDLIQYVKDHGTEVTGIKADIKANADAIDAIEADYLKAADKTELSNAITAEETRAKGVEGGLDTRLAAVEAAVGESGSVAGDIADALAEAKGYTDTEVKELADGAVATNAAAIDALEEKVGDKTVAIQIEEAIDALKIGDYAKAADLTAAITQHNTDKKVLEDAIALKANDADLAAIAKTGSTDDLVQGELVLVFDCGTSAV